MSRKVSIVLNLDSDEQSHYLEKHFRENMFVGKVVSYRNLPDTDLLKETDPIFRKLIKGVKDARKELDNYIHKHN